MMNTENTPLLTKANGQAAAKKGSGSFTSTRVLAIAGLAVVLFCGAALSPAGTQVSLAMGYYFGPGPLYAQAFYNDRGVGVGQCDDVSCGIGEPDIGEYRYVDNCLAGGGGCIGMTSGCRACSIDNFGTYPKWLPKCPKCIYDKLGKADPAPSVPFSMPNDPLNPAAPSPTPVANSTSPSDSSTPSDVPSDFPDPCVMADNNDQSSPNMFPLDPCGDITWPGSWAGVTIDDISANFNAARSHDTTVTGGSMDISAKYSQIEWDALSFQEKGLWLLNSERSARGIHLFNSIVPELVTISQDFSQYLSGTGGIMHNIATSDWANSQRDVSCDIDGDGKVSPVDRIQCDTKLKDNTETFRFSENLGMTSATSEAEMNEPIAWSIYTWIYADSGSNWGHRHFCLAAMNENNGVSPDEGLLGFGLSQSNAGTYTVMMAADESATWQHPDWDQIRTENIPQPN